MTRRARLIVTAAVAFLAVLAFVGLLGWGLWETAGAFINAYEGRLGRSGG